jgi:hypothetical protein
MEAIFGENRTKCGGEKHFCLSNFFSAGNCGNEWDWRGLIRTKMIADHGEKGTAKKMEAIKI